MATVTEHLGFAFTSSVLQTHPFTFARQVSTLDHLTAAAVGKKAGEPRRRGIGARYRHLVTS